MHTNNLGQTARMLLDGSVRPNLIRRVIYPAIMIAVVVLSAAVFLRSTEPPTFRDYIDCPAVKSGLETQTDRTKRALLQVDLRECLRMGFYKDWQVKELFN